MLYVCAKIETDICIRSKVVIGSQNFEILSRDPRHAQLGVNLRRRGAFSMCVPNLNWISLFLQNLLGDPKIRKLRHVTWAMSFYNPYARRVHPLCLYQI